MAVVVIWEALSASGWLYRDVVPSLVAIGRALYATLSDPSFYFHLGTTAYEIGIAMVIGGLSGLAVGILLGGSKFMSRAYEAYLYYLGPCPKIIFFPVMIMWFGVGPGSKVAMGAISCFFPVALNVAGGMREIDKVLDPRRQELPRQHLADGDQDLPAGHAPPGDQRRAARASAWR